MSTNQELTPEEYEDYKNRLLKAVRGNQIGSEEFFIMHQFESLYKPNVSLSEKLKELGFTELQVFSLIKRFESNITGIPRTTVSVVKPQEFEGTELPKMKWVVENMIPEGVSIVAAPAKYRKSFFALQLAVAISSGTDFLGFKTVPGECIYMDLESSQRRSLTRLQKMYSTLNIPGLQIVTSQSKIRRIGAGFERDVMDLLIEFPNTTLLIVDILKYIMPPRTDDTMYTSDYEAIGALNDIAAKYGISILVVHHTSKRFDERDPLNNIQGSTGLLGAVSAIILIMQQKRFDKASTIRITGNDVPTIELEAHFDDNTLLWYCDGDRAEIARKQFSERPEMETIRFIMRDRASWTGTASELSDAASSLGYSITPESFGKFLTIGHDTILSFGYSVDKNRTDAARTITITHPKV